MRGVYTMEVAIAGVNTARTLLHLAAPSTKCLEILSATITNPDNDSSEQLEASVDRVASGSTTGTAVTASTIQKHEAGDGDTTVTGKSNLTVEPTYAAQAFGHRGWNNLAGYEYVPLPEDRPIVSPSGSVGLRLRSVPAAPSNFIASITYREIGG